MCIVTWATCLCNRAPFCARRWAQWRMWQALVDQVLPHNGESGNAGSCSPVGTLAHCNNVVSSNKENKYHGTVGTPNVVPVLNICAIHTNIESSGEYSHKFHSQPSQPSNDLDIWLSDVRIKVKIDNNKKNCVILIPQVELHFYK